MTPVNERKDIGLQNISTSDDAIGRVRGRRKRDVYGRICNRYRCGRGIRCDLVQRGHRRFDRERADQHHQPCPRHQDLTGDGGFSTVEAALAIASLVAVFAIAVCGVAAVSTQVRCVDAAREAVRLVARGDEGRATGAARRIGPSAATMEIHREAGFVVARVSAPVRFLPGIHLSAEAVAALEPGQR